MSPIEVLAILLIMFQSLAIVALALAASKLQFDREDRQRALKDLEMERRLLADELKKLAKQSNEIGLHWTDLKDRVEKTEMKLTAIQANLSAGSNPIGVRPR